MRKLQFASIINLSLAEIASLQAVQLYSASPFSSFYSSDLFFIPLLVLPVIFMIRKDNPFNFIHYSILVTLSSGVILAKSETFYALLDAAYALGYEDLAIYINSVFSPYGNESIFQQLLLITMLFILSQVIWNSAERSEFKTAIFQWIYAFFILLMTFLIYPYFIGLLSSYDYPLLFMGIGGVICLLAAAYLLSR
jgi:xanthine/uracil permease